MVARTPQKQRKTMVAPPLSPTLIRETVKKMDQCMARLQELQYTVTGGNKVVAGVKLSPRSTKSYLKTSLRCKQECMRIRNNASKKSPTGKLPASVTGDWRRMSLSAMLVGETVNEILQASKFTREAVRNSKIDDPKTPLPQKQRSNQEKTPLKTRRKREKQHQFSITRPESSTPALQRARSKINFKVSPEKRPEIEGGSNGKQSVKHMANRVSPKHKPWAKKAVLFPNPLFHSSPTSKNQHFCKTKSPLIAKKRETPHKFLVKSPVKIQQKGVFNSVSPVKKPTTFSRKSPVKNQQKDVLNSVSPVKKPTTFSRKSPVKNQQKGVFNSVSPVTKPATTSNRRSPPKMASSSMASKLRRSLSPSRLVSRFVSPSKGRRVSMNSGSNFDGLKQRPPPLMMMPPMRFSAPKTVFGDAN